MIRQGFLFFACIIFSTMSVAQDRDAEGHLIQGKASYYAKKFQGRKTASGELFNNRDLTAAHRTLPFNSYVNVVNKINNRNVIVRVNDRGPFARGRVIDLSESAARKIGGYHRGLVPVHLEVLNLLHMTPALDSIFHASAFNDCLGNPAKPEDLSISLWSTHDLIHAIYVANDLYLKVDLPAIYIANKDSDGKRMYHVVVSGIPDQQKLKEQISYFETQGFMEVKRYDP